VEILIVSIFKKDLSVQKNLFSPTLSILNFVYESETEMDKKSHSYLNGKLNISILGKKVQVVYKEQATLHLRKPFSSQIEEIIKLTSCHIDNLKLNHENSFYSILWTTTIIQEKSSLLLFYRPVISGDLNAEYYSLSEIEKTIKPKYIGFLQVKFNENLWNINCSMCKFLI